MKNFCLFLLVALSLPTLAQSDKTLSYGLQWGLHANHSRFSGGMDEANARFQMNPYGGIGIDFIARYDHNSRWMATSGIGINTFGFEFALTENYQLLPAKRNYSVVRADYASFNVPFMIYYKFNPNCKNKRWVVGAGFVASATERKDLSTSFQKGTEGNTNYKYLNISGSSNGLSTVMFRFSAAKEKTLKCGGILHVAFLLNKGFSNLAQTEVMYTVDAKEYNHSFINNGDFGGIRVAYFFKSGKQILGK